MASLLPAVLAALLAVVASLACVAPVDPLWISGIYDAADQDDVVGLLDDGPATTPPEQSIEVALVPSELVVAAQPAPASRSDCSTVRLRSPPPPTT